MTLVKPAQLVGMMPRESLGAAMPAAESLFMNLPACMAAIGRNAPTVR